MAANITYLALGSNLGDRLLHLRKAIGSLPAAVRVQEESRVYETPPWGYEDQPAFLNMVVRAETDLSPRALLAAAKLIETQMGRKATFRYGPRVIDVDILFYDDLVLKEADLVIPHPALHLRAFVLVPLADVGPQVVHPVLRRPISELLAALDVSEIKPYHA